MPTVVKYATFVLHKYCKLGDNHSDVGKGVKNILHIRTLVHHNVSTKKLCTISGLARFLAAGVSHSNGRL